MAVYLIANVEITDPVAFGEYLEAVPTMIAEHGGTYIARGGAVEVLEGDWNPKRLAIIRFESAELLKAWYESEEYQPLLGIRQGASVSKLVTVEGV